jgi:hypothetical protein
MLRFVLFLLSPRGWFVALFLGVFLYNAVTMAPDYFGKSGPFWMNAAAHPAPRSPVTHRSVRTAPRTPAAGRAASVTPEADGRP